MTFNVPADCYYRDSHQVYIPSPVFQAPDTVDTVHVSMDMSALEVEALVQIWTHYLRFHSSDTLI